MESLICTHCENANSPAAKYCAACGFALPIKAPKAKELIEIKTNKPKTNFTKKITFIFSFTLAFIVFYFITQFLFSSGNSIDKQLSSLAIEMNKNCPMMVDEITRMDGITALPNNHIEYNYTLINQLVSEVSVEQLENFLKPSIIHAIKISPEMIFYRNNKTTLVYNYKDKEGVEILKMRIGPDEYE